MKCVVLFTIDDLFDGNGWKNLEIYKNTKLVALPSPPSAKHRKQAGPTLGGTEILV